MGWSSDLGPPMVGDSPPFYIGMDCLWKKS